MAYLPPNNAADYDRSDGDTEPLSLETTFAIEANTKVETCSNLVYLTYRSNRSKCQNCFRRILLLMPEKALAFGNIYDVHRHEEQVRERVTAGQELQKELPASLPMIRVSSSIDVH